jgi:hypothetical protein
MTSARYVPMHITKASRFQIGRFSYRPSRADQRDGFPMRCLAFGFLHTKRFAGLLAAASILIGQAAKSVTFIEINNASCQTWINEHKIDSAARWEAWIYGFLSGWAFAEGPGDPLAGKDPAALAERISHYCAAHPLDTLSLAVREPHPRVGSLADEHRETVGAGRRDVPCVQGSH